MNKMIWHNEPSIWKREEASLIVTSEPQTDFWCKTHSGEISDSGHFYYQKVTGDFSSEVKVSGDFKELYDQAGLMVRQDAFHWLKCGVEYVNSIRYVSAVLTREWSDWSILPLPDTDTTWFRVNRIGHNLEAHYSTDGINFTMYRQTYLTEAPTLEVGIMIASPKGSGFIAIFEDFKLTSSGSNP
jgi:regulation of enolase protein 1 (concanavalin A-like superfamily)